MQKRLVLLPLPSSRKMKVDMAYEQNISATVKWHCSYGRDPKRSMAQGQKESTLGLAPRSSGNLPVMTGI